MFGRLGMYHHLPENRDLRTRRVPHPNSPRVQANPGDRAMLLRLGIVVLVAVIVVALTRWITV